MKKGTDTERREGSNNKPNRAGEQGQKKVQKQRSLKKKSFYTFLLTFYSLTLHDLFFCEKFNGGKKINQQSWNQKVSWMPFAVGLTLKRL